MRTYKVFKADMGNNISAWKCELYIDEEMIAAYYFHEKGAAVATGLDHIEFGDEAEDLLDVNFD